MELREYIEKAANTAGSVAELARMLDLSREATSLAKGHKRPLPIDACVKLADYIKVDRMNVIAANELATEKKVEKREYWKGLLERASAAAMVVSIATVTNFVTTTDANALPLDMTEKYSLYYVKLRMLIAFRRNLEKLHLERLYKRVTETFFPFFVVRILQVERI